MRTWEFEDIRAGASDLVREQDFILRVRRMQRHATPHLVINLVLTVIESFSKHQGAREAVQKQLQEFAKVTQGTYAEMSNGDVFIAWEETPATQALPAKIVNAVLPEAVKGENTDQFLLTYNMPKDYTALRERTNHYVEIAQNGLAAGEENSTSEILRSAALRGHLTAWNVDQIGKLLGEIDLRRYAHTQSIYHHEANGIWKPLCEEYFISFEDLRRERFPRLEIVTPEHLFLALCEILDQRLLTILTEHPETINSRNVRLNLSVRSIMGSIFAQFIRAIPRERRATIGFELHCGDLFQDFSLTKSAIDALHTEGFKVIIDGVMPEMVDYLNLAAFKVDHIKINASKDCAAQLDTTTIQQSLVRLAPEKLIFFRCDNEEALAVGLKMGVTHFQGWLIDDNAHGKSKI